MTFEHDRVTRIGMAHSRYGDRPFGIRNSDRMRHVYILGQTGTGKSTLLLQMILDDIAAGQGVCLLDPHGDLAERIRRASAANSIHWILADENCPFGYNPLTRTSPRFRPLIASGLIETLKKQWADAWGARMEHILRYALLALLDQPRADLRDIMRLFLDRPFRTEVISRVTDEQVRQFWQKEFPAMNYKTAFDGVAPIANKLGGFLANPVVRRSLCEPETPLRFRRLMDEGQSLIVNLSKGQLGADIADMVGGMILSGFAHAAFSRHGTPESNRRPYILFADEFHAFTTEALADMISELRKYGLSLTLANQYLAQIERPVREALFGNVGTLISFRVGAHDGVEIARQMDWPRQADLIALPNYRMFVRLMVDGARTKAFSASSFPPPRAAP